MRTVVGALQQYDWGDTTALPRLLQLPADGNPWAEMWFGTHHMAPSHLDSPQGPTLQSVTGDMNMLVKLLACAQPLSLQTHPTLEQAQHGFANEEAAGIDRAAPTRMYRDASDKPEMLIALEPFEALCGFAPIDASISLLHAMGWSNEARALDEDGIDVYLVWAFEQTGTLLFDHAPEWLQRIASLYPHDKGLRIAPLLNHVMLQPGEAIALPAGNLHAYLRGTGLEIMKSSDNVVRAGFTKKHVDVTELLRIVEPNELPNPVHQPVSTNGIATYSSPSEAFSVTAVDSELVRELPAVPHHRLVFGHFDAAPSMQLIAAGESATLPANAGTFWVCTQN